MGNPQVVNITFLLSFHCAFRIHPFNAEISLRMMGDLGDFPMVSWAIEASHMGKSPRQDTNGKSMGHPPESCGALLGITYPTWL